MIERSLIIIKPDGVARGLVGDVIKRFELTGMKIIALKMEWVDAEFAAKHYKAHVEKPFFSELVDFLIEGPVVAFVVEGAHAVQNVRKIVGPTSPNEAPPGTIRGDYAHLSMKHASENKIGGRNIIHASGNAKESVQEIMLWFDESELHSYDNVHRKHVY